MEQPPEQVRPPLVAHPEATAAEQPGERPLHHPAVPSQSRRGVDPTTSNAWGDPARTHGTPEGRRVVGFVGVQLGRALTRSSWSAPRADDRGDGIDERDELRGVVGVGRREANHQWDTAPIHHNVVLGAEFASVDRIRPRLLAPLFARTLRLSTLARDQSMAASSPSQLSSLVCNRSQTPASCQSRSRRQHVVPLPQPSSFGSNRQGQPLRKTKTMPTRAARSGTRGRPPLGLGGSSGRSGAMASQRTSGTRDEAFMARHHASPPRFCNTL